MQGTTMIADRCGVQKGNQYAAIDPRDNEIRMLREQIAELERKLTKEPIQMESIIKYVCRYYGCHLYQVRSRTRLINITLARHMAIYLCRILGRPRYSYTMIGKLFGGRDHTSVLHAVRRIERERMTNKAMQVDIETLTEHFYQRGDPAWPERHLHHV